MHARQDTVGAALQLQSPLANRTRARVKARSFGGRVRVELSGKFAHLVNSVYVRTDVHLDSVPGAQAVYTKDGTLQPNSAHWLGIYRPTAAGEGAGWILGDLVRTATVFALALGNAPSHPEDVQRWVVHEKEGGVDGGGWVERDGYVTTAV